MADEPVVPVEPVVKRGRGRPKGSVSKGSETLAPGELRDVIAGSLTRKEVGRLPAGKRADLLVKMEPKPPAESQGTNVRLILIGPPGWFCAHCGKKQPKDWNGKDQPMDPPLDVPSGESSTAEAPARPVPPDDSWKQRMPGVGKREPCPEFQARRCPSDTDPKPEPPPAGLRGYVFTVPRGPDELGPPEWRTPLYPPKKEN